MKIEKGMLVENVLPGAENKVIVVRVLGFIEAVGQWRVTDALEVRDDAWLIEHNRTWAAPLANLRPHDAACVVCHEDGLVSFA